MVTRLCKADEVEDSLEAKIQNRLNEKNEEHESILKQKSRIQWLKEEDLNTRFFYSTVKKKRWQNNIQGVSVKGEWITNPDHIKEIFVEHFEQRFKREKSPLCFKIEGLQVNIISPQVARKLEERFQNSEIKEALFSIDPGKSPGPDGLNGFYLRNFWEVLQEDIIRFHKVFYEE